MNQEVKYLAQSCPAQERLSWRMNPGLPTLAYRMQDSSPEPPPPGGSPHKPGCPWELSALRPQMPGLPGGQKLSKYTTFWATFLCPGWPDPQLGPPARCPSPLTDSPLVYFQVCFLKAAPGSSRPPQGALRSVTATLWQSTVAPKC